MILYEDHIVQFLHKPSGCLLWAPRTFLALDPDELPLLYNGCGPSGLFARVVPEHVLRLKITFLCYIHDHMYEMCACEADEDVADAVFAANLNLWIVHHSSWYNKLPRFISAAKFQHAVSCTIFSSSYWEENLKFCPTGRRYALSEVNFG